MQIKTLITGTIQSWRHLLVHNAPEGIRMEVPVKCFYIEHAGHKLLFDAGQKPLNYQQLPSADYLVKVTDQQTAAALLKQAEVPLEDIEYIVLSHLHSDHSAGLVDFPGATVLLQAREVAGKDPANLAENIQLVTGQCDIYGDGRLIILPSFGHTPGHQSLLITQDDSSQLLLTGDAAYTADAVNYDCTPEEYRRKTAYFDTLKALRKMQNNNIKLIYSHE